MAAPKSGSEGDSHRKHSDDGNGGVEDWFIIFEKITDIHSESPALADLKSAGTGITRPEPRQDGQVSATVMKPQG